MDNLSSSNSHLAETGLVELHRELAQAWGIDFQRVRALVCQLTSSSWCSVSELIARTLLSHWNVTHLLLAPSLAGARRRSRPHLRRLPGSFPRRFRLLAPLKRVLPYPL